MLYQSLRRSSSVEEQLLRARLFVLLKYKMKRNSQFTGQEMKRMHSRALEVPTVVATRYTLCWHFEAGQIPTPLFPWHCEPAEDQKQKKIVSSNHHRCFL